MRNTTTSQHAWDVDSRGNIVRRTDIRMGGNVPSTASRVLETLTADLHLSAWLPARLSAAIFGRPAILYPVLGLILLAVVI